jgi:hypothetical protein
MTRFAEGSPVVASRLKGSVYVGLLEFRWTDIRCIYHEERFDSDCDRDCDGDGDGGGDSSWWT